MFIKGIKLKGKFIFVFIIFLFIVFFLIHKAITPVFFSRAEVQAYRIASNVINEAVMRTAEIVNYQDMVKFVYSDDGNYVVMMQPDTAYINKINSRIALDIEKNLSEIEHDVISIPLFRMLGLEILTGYGPKLNARILPAGFSKPPVINDSFSAAGINQTRHKIYLEVEADIMMIAPFTRKSLKVPAQVPVTEVVIIGRVPETYISFDEGVLKGILN